MKNFPVIIEGKEFWISRSIATCGVIFTIDNGFRVLAVKRGKGCPNEVGKWCCPCGYLDYNETIKEACIREVKEETNLSLDRTIVYKWFVNDDPNDDNQNITVGFYSVSNRYAEQTITGAFGEKDEVDDVEWIALDEIGNYNWAFNHKNRIIEFALTHLRHHYVIDNDTRNYLMNLYTDKTYLW